MFLDDYALATTWPAMEISLLRNFLKVFPLCPDFYIERCKGYTLTKAIKEQSDGNDAVSDGYEFNKYYAGKRTADSSLQEICCGFIGYVCYPGQREGCISRT